MTARAAPFVLFTISLASGIWVASQFFIPGWMALAIAALGLLSLMAAARAKNETAIWLCAALFLFGAGASRQNLARPDLGKNALPNANGYAVILEGVVAEEPDVRPDAIRLRVRVSVTELNDPDAPDLPATLGAGQLVLIRVQPSTAWQYGDVIRAVGKLDAPPVMAEFSYRDYLARQNIRSWMPSPDSAERLAQGRYESVPYAITLRVKDAVRQSVRRMMPAPESALLNGILIGDDNALPDDVVQAFRRTGASHIIAISGFNVSIIAGVMALALGRLFNQRLAAAIAIPLILAYMVLVGASASVVRAAFMAVIALIGQLLWRKGFTLNTLCASAFIMLAHDPGVLFDSGFQLSFAATAGLVLYANRLQAPVKKFVEARTPEKWVRRVVEIFTETVLVTLAAQLTTLPLILGSFKQLSLISLVTNALALPVQSVLMVSGVIAAVLGIFIPPPFITVLAAPSYLLLAYTIKIVQITAALPFASIPIYDFGPGAAIVYYLALFGLSWLMALPPQQRRALADGVRARGAAGLITLTVLAGAGGFAVWYFQKPDGKLHVTFSGGGAFAQTPAGNQFIFAGSGDVLSIASRAMPVWDRQAEFVFAPSRSERVRAGTLPVLQKYAVGQFIQPPALSHADEISDTWTSDAQTLVGGFLAPRQGERIQLEPGLALVIIPRGRAELGARLEYGSVKIDLAGESLTLAGTLDGDSVVFVSPRQRDAVEQLNKAAPRWVVWADAGAIPRGLDAKIRAISLRETGPAEFVTDGKTITLR
ncbi:MAG TPA: ComEC/Rec2 family competence protein [Thermoflexales bacterium]|nr:ComEC/Rec2 family competence protein [Thermoflexales bacterium]HRA00214.1 ComEC/Rec2 family competence protein [Thermoflexales bacterium]